MKVSELIAKLSELPPDMLVFIDNGGCARPVNNLFVDEVMDMKRKYAKLSGFVTRDDSGPSFDPDVGVEDGMKVLVL
jgi:hypothetical protein